MMYDAPSKGRNALQLRVTVEPSTLALKACGASGGKIHGRPVAEPLTNTTSFDAMLSPNGFAAFTRTYNGDRSTYMNGADVVVSPVETRKRSASPGREPPSMM